MKRSVLSIVFLLAVVSCAFAQEKHQLRVGFPEGNFIMTQESTMKTTTEVMGQKIPSGQKSAFTFSVVASAKDTEGQQTVKIELKRIQMQQKAMQFELKFDSNDEKDEVPAMAKPFRAMLGMKLTIKMDKDGKPVSVEGFDEFFENMIKEMPEATRPMLQGMKEQLGGNSFIKSFSQATDLMPKEPVAVGDAWKTETTAPVPMIGDVKMQTENKFLAIETIDNVQLAVIESISKMGSTEGKEVQMGPMKMTVKEISVETKSKLKIELASGLNVENVANIVMAAAISGGGGENQPPIELKIQGEGQTTVRTERAK